MELDKTTIAIRERSYPDILDLALHVARAYAGPLLLATAVGVVPMALLNHWLLADYLEFDNELGVPFEYLLYMLLLITWEMPLAAAPATLYLGESLFSHRPEIRKIAANLRRAVWQLLLYQVVWRGWLVAVVMWAPMPLAVLAGMGLCVLWPYLYIWRPYLNEVILLERNPMRRRGRDALTTARRSRLLHGGWSGELFGRWLGALGVGILLFASLLGTLWVSRVILLTEIEWDTLMWTWYWQIALWIVAGYFTVARFLSYLDLRIRREGWEVELAMRAEEVRLTRQLT